MEVRLNRNIDLEYVTDIISTINLNDNISNYTTSVLNGYNFNSYTTKTVLYINTKFSKNDGYFLIKQPTIDLKIDVLIKPSPESLKTILATYENISWVDYAL